MIKYLFSIFLITLLGFSAIAQEVLTTPAFNPVVAKQYQITKSELKSAKTSSSAITLPFYDDFSVISVFPLASRWVDKCAFINTDNAKYPPSIGVATLDALDSTGALYANAGPNPFDADYLTSVPIRLDSLFTPVKRALTRADLLYLSFYYQPQGRTISPPSKKASLVLEFHSPEEFDTIVTPTATTIEPRWREIWSTEGGVQVDTFAKQNGQYFKRVQIPLTSIEDSILYYKNGFQFRFRNIAALAGNSQPDWRNNGSHWNIDIVWLSNRPSLNDTSLSDVAFADLAPSMLKNYESMPFRQYRKKYIDEMKDTLDIKIANLGNVLQNISYKYDMRKNSLPPFKAYDESSYNIPPFFSDGYSDWPAFARPPVVSYFPPSLDEKVVFHIIHTITPDVDPLFRTNDSIQFDQLFSNYYAYDNGTAEAGIGINGSAGSYAVQFKLNEADTLWGMKIFFNPVISGSNQEVIDLNVWNDAFGKPGQIIKTLSGITPSYTGSLNEFNTYMFETPLVIDPVTFPSLYFYIGWTQSSVNNLNVGLDRYKDSHLKRYFNVDGNWENSSEINYGSLLMRPIVGPENPLDVVNPSKIQKLAFYPNPVTDGKLIIQLPEKWKSLAESSLNINIYSISGSCVMNEQYSSPVNVNSLATGIYMVILTDSNTGEKASGKLVVR